MKTKLEKDGLPVGYFSQEDIRFYTWFANCIMEGGIFVEIGSYFGRSTCVAAPILRARKARMICVDTWQGTPGDQTGAAATLFDLRKVFNANVKHFGIDTFIEPVQKDSILAANCFASGSIDGIFIDANHNYNAVRADILAWLPKLKNRCIIAGHDYYWNPASAPHCAGVKVAVDEIFGEPDCVTGSCWHVQKTDFRKIVTA